MGELRRELTIDVRDVSRSAREMASPMYYIRHFPWASAAVALAVGYVLVPKKKQVVKPDPEMLAEMVRKQQVKIDTAKVSSDKDSMLKSLVVMGLTWGLKTGLNYMTQRITTAAVQKSQQEQQVSPEAAAREEDSWST
jgi:hypothetical protein